MVVRNSIKVNVEKGWSGDQPAPSGWVMTGRIRELSAEMANRIANLYVEENLKTRETQAENTSEFIESQLAEAKKKAGLAGSRLLAVTKSSITASSTAGKCAHWDSRPSAYGIAGEQ